MKPIIVADLTFATPEAAFAFAERLCAAAYAAQGGPAKDPEERYTQQEAREQRKASWLEELYCRIRDMADDWHRESIRRRDGLEQGQFNAEFCDVEKAIVRTGKTVNARVSDWSY